MKWQEMKASVGFYTFINSIEKTFLIMEQKKFQDEALYFVHKAKIKNFSNIEDVSLPIL